MSKANKWTEGPWSPGRPDIGTLVDGVESKWIYAGEQYVAVASGQIKGEWDEVMANAHLIASAPELYEALKRLVDEHGMAYPVRRDALKYAREILTKAEAGA